MIKMLVSADPNSPALRRLTHATRELDLELVTDTTPPVAGELRIWSRRDEGWVNITNAERKSSDELLDETVRFVEFDFSTLPLIVEGESKIVKRLTRRLVVEKFKPTVYSYTENRCGIVEGSEFTRARFSAAVFRSLRAAPEISVKLQHAFITLIDDGNDVYTVQRLVESCNLEVRVKRFHIGSPLHRYKFTERIPGVSGEAITRWSRFNDLIVCFDWRNPMHDEKGGRLADEPLSDDYAALWMNDVPIAKALARQVFLHLESLFLASGFVLIDACFFIDKTGKTFFGEISPDCMRVRALGKDPADAASFDKDVWRAGGTSLNVADRYLELYQKLFCVETLV